RIVALAEGVGCTEGPETLRRLISQRARWQRVILETVWHYRRMLFNPRYGLVGWIGMPLYLFSEILAPVFVVTSIVATIAGGLMGVLEWRGVALQLGAVVLANSFLTNTALLMSERMDRNYPLRDLLWLMVYGVLDVPVYRP